MRDIYMGGRYPVQAQLAHILHAPLLTCRLGKRIKSEINSRMLTVVFTLLAILVAGAGFFYEVETAYSDRYPDLTFAQSLYWSAVTVTTIGAWLTNPSAGWLIGVWCNC